MTRKSSKQLKFVAFIMSLVMLMTVAPLSAFAENGVIDTSEAIDQVLSGDEIISDVEPAAVDNIVTLTAADVPEFIAMSDLTTRGTIRRVYEEESDMSTILFENNDGTRTLYMYGVPVKYVAPDGTMRDKSTAISSLSGLQALWNGTTLTPGQMTTLAQNASIGRLELGQAAEALSLMNTRLIATYGATLKLSDMAYASLDSDIRSLYPTAVSDGVVLNYGDYSIRTIPVATGSLVLPGAANVAESTSLTDNDIRTRVRYSNAFGLGTILQYTPTTMGVKEEIILTSNVGKNSFSFRIETGGLTIEEENGNYYFFDPATQRVIAQLGEIIAYDSNGQIARGAVTVQSVIAGQRYNVMISVSPEFLANAAYPVSVDPTTTIYATNSAAIQYASLYNTAEAWGYTFESFHVFGTETSFSSYGPTFVGRALFRFPGFGDAFCDYGLISASQLASLELKLPTNANLSMSAHPAATSWTSGTRICDASMFNYYDISYSGGGSYSNGNIVVDLTSIAKMWLDCQTGANNYAFGSLSNGVIVMLDNESQYCTVTASEVSAVVDYTYSGYVGDFYFNNAYSHEFLINNGGTLSMGSYYISDSNPAGAITWEVEYLSNGEYAIHPNGSDILYLAANNSGPYILSSSIGVSSHHDARWNLSNSTGGGVELITTSGYTLGVNAAGGLIAVTDSSFADSSQKSWFMINTDSYKQLPLNWGVENVAITPSESLYLPTHLIQGDYSLTSLNFFAVNCNNEYITFNNDFLTGIPGITVAISVTHIPTGQERSFTFTIDPLDSGIYYIHDGISLGLMRSSNSNTSISLDAFERSTAEQWFFEHYPNGTYAIKSVADTSKVLTTTGTGNISLTPMNGAPSLGQQWKLFHGASGAYQIISILHDDNCLLVDNGTVKLGTWSTFYEWNLLTPAAETFTHITMASQNYKTDAEVWEYVTETFYENKHIIGRTFSPTTKADFLNELKTTNYFCAAAHSDVNSASIGWPVEDENAITLEDINAIPASELADLKLVVLLVCGAADYADALAAKGVDVVIGFDRDIERNLATWWYEIFLDTYLNNGENAMLAKDVANDYFDFSNDETRREMIYAAIRDWYPMENLTTTQMNDAISSVINGCYIGGTS